jgi:DNA-directed RNA polymerase specialized sigma24 family protein
MTNRNFQAVHRCSTAGNPLTRGGNHCPPGHVSEVVKDTTGRSADDAFTDFVTARSAWLIAHAEMLCGNPEQARDVVQTVLMRAYPRWRRIEREDPYDVLEWAARDGRHQQIQWLADGSRFTITTHFGTQDAETELLDDDALRDLIPTIVRYSD